MKFSINDKVVLELNDIQIKVMQDNIFKEQFEESMADRIRWVITKKYEDSLRHLKEEWIPKLKQAGIESIPLDDEKFAKLVFEQKEYKPRSDRDKPLPSKV